MADVLLSGDIAKSKIRVAPNLSGWFGTFLTALLAGIYILTISKPLLWISREADIQVPFWLLGVASLAALVSMIWQFGWPRQMLGFLPQSLIALCALLSFWMFPILQQLSAAFALLGLYGFFASYARVTPDLWRKGFILAGLAALAFPFALVPGTGAGFYLRLVTADTAAQLLAMMGHTSLGAHDVLIFDNGIAQVDIPCSGLKSLFTGTAFFLVASIILRRSITFGWIFAYSIFIGLMLMANTLRVTLLIWISEILEKRALAESIHMSIGLVLFCGVCVVGIYMLIKTKPYSVQPYSVQQAAAAKIWQGRYISIFVLLIGLAGLAFAKPTTTTPMNANLIPFNALNIVQIPLTETEKTFFAARTQTHAAKWTFTYKELSGSMLVVRSRAANGLHAPEVCLLGNGISVQSMASMPLEAGGSYRWLTVDEEKRNAVYWMQNDNIITDDFRKRLSGYIFKGRRDWTMVTLLFDGRLNPDTPDVQILMGKLQNHYAGIK